MTPFRAHLAVTDFSGTGTGSEREILTLDLQFEDNEVLDVIAVQCDLLMNEPTISTDSFLKWAVGLFENPDQTTTTDIMAEAEFETDTALIHAELGIYNVDFGSAVGINSIESDWHRYFIFPQPYTVARNIAVILEGQGTEGDAKTLEAYVTMWGRRRNAQDAEFKNIIYRQRF